MPTGASCTAPVTIGANFNTGANFDPNVGWRAAHILIMIGIALALIPTYAYFNVGGAIGDDDTRR
ncbi:hypothetical protein BZG78_07350 [Salinivibrio sp. MA351]|nr:hypothetical protein BZG78_07350 [Salinivibrio sp. MA351]